MMNNLSINTEDPPTVQKGTAGLAPQTRAPAVILYYRLEGNSSFLSLFFITVELSNYCRAHEELPFTLRKRRLQSLLLRKSNKPDSIQTDRTRLAHRTG